MVCLIVCLNNGLQSIQQCCVDLNSSRNYEAELRSTLQRVPAADHAQDGGSAPSDASPQRRASSSSVQLQPLLHNLMHRPSLTHVCLPIVFSAFQQPFTLHS